MTVRSDSADRPAGGLSGSARAKKRPRGWWLKPLLHLAFTLPLVITGVGFFSGALGVNPIEGLMRELGEWALRLLLLTLAVTPIVKVTGFNPLARCRRMIGLWAFAYVCLHLLTYVILDQALFVPGIIEDVVKRNFIFFGMAGFLVLLPLAVTSTDAMIKRLGAKNWRRLHKLVYLAGILGIVHFFLFLKADYREFYVYAGILAVLLGFRLVKRIYR